MGALTLWDAAMPETTLAVPTTASSVPPAVADRLPVKAVPAPPGAVRDPIRGALMESRDRWRHFVSMAADMAFETDAKGRFVFVTPESVLGWPAGALIGQPSERLVGDD